MRSGQTVGGVGGVRFVDEIGFAFGWIAPELRFRVRAIAIRAYCDPLIAADFNFLLGHEQDPMRWQSGPLEAADEGR